MAYGNEWQRELKRLLCIGVFLLLLPSGLTAEPVSKKIKIESLSAYEMAELALVDTLYYRFDDWFQKFKERIEQLEKEPPTRHNQMERMKFYFYMAGLYGEFTHVLSITSKFQVDNVKQNFIHYSEKAKELAEALLEESDLSPIDRADAYFFLGASEGYVGLLDYGEGHFLSALINGLRADNHFEDALQLDPGHSDAHVGLGVYRYGNSRLGGLSNLIMQGGSDLRKVGLDHIERALRTRIMSRPLAIKTLIWFYISEQINPDNRDLPETDPLSPVQCRSRTWQLIEEYRELYFKNIEDPEFIGNKGMMVMEAIQYALDGKYGEAEQRFQKAVDISHFLVEQKGFKLNPKYVDTMMSGIKFCQLMVLSQQDKSSSSPDHTCSKINEQIQFVEGGGSLIEYESSKIRGEIQDVFFQRLLKMSEKHRC